MGTLSVLAPDSDLWGRHGDRALYGMHLALALAVLI